MNEKESTPQSEIESRKDAHLDLALSSRNEAVDSRFYYEPMLSGHPEDGEEWPLSIGKKKLRYPIWISSMTGGTKKTNEINERLATIAGKYGLGMGVGSARIALESKEKEKGFQLRPLLGNASPLYLNFGIAQVEECIAQGKTDVLTALADRLKADGIIIHVNPLQEWMQPEGDRIKRPPIETISRFMEETPISLIVKEVGQGFGYESMKQLLQLPLTAIEFAANGGTNFSKLELMRDRSKSDELMPFVYVGQDAGEMVELSNRLKHELGEKLKCSTLIISGGIKNFLDGYYYIQKSQFNALYGQASGFLKHAQKSPEDLENYVKYQIEGLMLAKTFLTLKNK